MGWFTGKQDSPAMRDDQGTISDAEWRRLQTRAAKSNPKRADWFSDEARKHALRGAQQYRNRTQS